MFIEKYDAEVDVLRVRWSDAAIEESDEDQPGIILDYDADGNIVGVEILQDLRTCPLNPPILGDFEVLLPQNWGLGGSF